MTKFESAVTHETPHSGEVKGIEVEESQLLKVDNQTPLKMKGLEEIDLVNPVSESQSQVDLSNDVDSFTPLKRESPTEIINAASCTS